MCRLLDWWRYRPRGRASAARYCPERDRGPDFRIFAGATEFGVAWKKTTRETQRKYFSVKLDNPSFTTPIYASLVEAQDGKSCNLIWSSRNGN